MVFSEREPTAWSRSSTVLTSLVFCFGPTFCLCALTVEHTYVDKFRPRTTAAVFTPTNILNSARTEVSYHLRHSPRNETVAHMVTSDVTEKFVW